MVQDLNGIPIIDSINNLEEQAIDKLLSTGICYLKRFNKDNVEPSLQGLRAKATTFFNNPSEQKSATPGYDDRRKLANPEQVERLAFPIVHPPLFFNKQQSAIQNINKNFLNQVIKPLLEAIFTYVKKPELTDKIIDSEGTYCSIVNYPDDEEFNGISTLGLKKHKDLGLVTVLSVTEPGLKILTKPQGEKVWVDIEPLDDYYVIILAKALQLILGKHKCNAVSHKVELTNRKRMTVGFFFNPPPDALIADSFTGQVYFEKFIPDYVQSRLMKYQ